MLITKFEEAHLNIARIGEHLIWIIINSHLGFLSYTSYMDSFKTNKNGFTTFTNITPTSPTFGSNALR